eukprot:COSAG05_NODE_29725_length_105_cov_152711.666667_1_plen_25_part_01
MYSLDQLMHLGAYNWHLPVDCLITH